MWLAEVWSKQLPVRHVLREVTAVPATLPLPQTDMTRRNNLEDYDFNFYHSKIRNVIMLILT